MNRPDKHRSRTQQDRQLHERGQSHTRGYYQQRPEAYEDMPAETSESQYAGRYSGQKYEDLYDPVDEMFESEATPHRGGRTPDKYRQSARPRAWSGRREEAPLREEAGGERGAYYQHPYGTYWEPSGHFIGQGPRGYQRSDERLLEDVCESLTWDPEVDAREIEVSVEHGEVTLSGEVPNRQMKRWAEQTADEISGVVDVHNRLRIKKQNRSQESH